MVLELEGGGASAACGGGCASGGGGRECLMLGGRAAQSEPAFGCANFKRIVSVKKAAPKV